MFGLFGYNEKTYNKNTAIFKNRLTSLYSNLSTRGINTTKAGNMITSLINSLDFFDYPAGKDARILKGIDERITAIINTMEADAAGKNVPKLILHAKMLSDVIQDCRSSGIEAQNDEYYRNEEKMADCLGDIQKLNARKAFIAKEKQRILNERTILQARGALEEIEDLRIEYNNLHAEEETLNMTIHSLQEEYNTNYEALLRKKQSTTFEKLANDGYSVMTERELDKMLDKMAENVEKHAEKIKTKKGSLDRFKKEYAGSMGQQASASPFDADYEAKQARDAASQVNSANYNGAQKKDPFDAACEKMDV